MVRIRLIIGVAVLTLLSAAGVTLCQRAGPLLGGTDLDAASAVKDYYADWLTSIPGVSRVSVRDNDKGVAEILVEVSETTPALKQIPAKLNGIPVVIAALPQADGEQFQTDLPSPIPLLPEPTVEAEPTPTPRPPRFQR